MTGNSTRQDRVLLAVNAISHLLVDGLCAATLFGPVQATAAALPMLILIYDTLAFSTQCLAGLWLDRVPRRGGAAAGAMLLIVLGFVLPLPPGARVACIGVGNSLFHVAGAS